MARTYNPLDREPAILQLPGKDYEVAEATRKILRKVEAFQQQHAQLDENTDTDEAVRILAEMIGAALVNGDDAAARIIDAWNADQLSLSALVRTAEFVAEELRGSISGGEV